jgi:hypothetical protein
MLRLIAVGLALMLTACATDSGATASPDPFDGISAADPLELPGPGRLEHGVAYRFTLGHCGLHSPIDVDGSYWDEIDGQDRAGAPLDLENDGEMINATSGAIVVIGDEMRFRTDGGSVVRFSRHDGDKDFPPCL